MQQFRFVEASGFVELVWKKALMHMPVIATYARTFSKTQVAIGEHGKNLLIFVVAVNKCP